MPPLSPLSSHPSLPARLYERDVVQGMVPLNLVRVLGEYLSSKGLDPHGVLPRDLDLGSANPLGRFSAEAYCQLLIKAAERLHDPLLGLHLGQTIQPAHLGALGYVLLACENLGGALQRIQRYHRLVHDINPVQHRIEGGNLELQWGIAHGKPGALFDESGIAGLVQFGRDVCAQQLPLVQVDFVNPPPSDLRPYLDYFGCPVRFNQPMTRLAIPLDSLMAPLRQADPTLLKLMEEQVDAAMAQLPDAGDLGEVTRRVVAHLAPLGTPELEQVAQALRLSPRVFYRRLAEQGLNFRDLRETALQQVAELHLRDPRLTLAEVGALLGYSEQSAFSRAFKRWSGVPPLQWRQGLKDV
ncbi:AraC family transcriptional regulator [Aquabacterium sp. CECT 9606]|uniref:AraC family transcriptional regulator n=1 Tax=Aquabacterium sp. CECT 9606 TaxID=2845822 RepID=UPI001E36314B|nr:AraC family transcriptional regulator [Aquabacterium sp. CECT 9606]CAH0350880.1 putative HTH-type transcriptional regulator [Aquabacterium sp. CECT 9606]